MYVIVHGPIGGKIGAIKEMSEAKAVAAIAAGYASPVLVSRPAAAAAPAAASAAAVADADDDDDDGDNDEDVAGTADPDSTDS